MKEGPSISEDACEVLFLIEKQANNPCLFRLNPVTCQGMPCSYKAVGIHVYLAMYSQASVANLWCLVLCDIYHIADTLLVPKMHPVKASL